MAVAKFGLGRSDLNYLARISLAGLTEEPERHLSNLLRSMQPIEDLTRRALADALDGKSLGTKLKVTETKQREFVRRFRRLRRQIELGRLVQAKLDKLTYNEAINEVVKICPYGEKSVQSFHTLANKLACWVQQCWDAGLEHSDAALEVAFVYSELKGVERMDALKPSVEGLAELLESFERQLVDAQGSLAKSKSTATR